MNDKAQSWLIIPRDPVIVRDGRPFGPDPGARAQSLPFPFPATLAGAVRTRHGEQQGGFDVNGIMAARVRSLSVHGPFLVQLAEDGDAAPQLLLPAPGDALLLPKSKDAPALRRWLRPLEVDARAQSDLDGGLAYVGMPRPENAKPLSDPPTFWWWEAYQSWLENPGDGPIELDELGIRRLTAESRVHVRIDAASGTADEGFLFQTSGLEFNRRLCPEPEWRLARMATLGLLVATDARMEDGLGSLGGERRTVFWRRGEDSLPACPPGIQQGIGSAQACRLMLTTPGIFADGLLPRLDWLAIPGLQVAIKGAVASRYDVISGWDYEQNTAKTTRRLAPSGAVYYLSLAGSSDQAIDDFIGRVWFQPISDDLQDRRDGFGIAVLGAWDGKLERLEVNA